MPIGKYFDVNINPYLQLKTTWFLLVVLPPKGTNLPRGVFWSIPVGNGTGRYVWLYDKVIAQAQDNACARAIFTFLTSMFSSTAFAFARGHAVWAERSALRESIASSLPRAAAIQLSNLPPPTPRYAIAEDITPRGNAMQLSRELPLRQKGLGRTPPKKHIAVAHAGRAASPINDSLGDVPDYVVIRDGHGGGQAVLGEKEFATPGAHGRHASLATLTGGGVAKHRYVGPKNQIARNSRPRPPLQCAPSSSSSSSSSSR